MARITLSERFRIELDEALVGVSQEQDPVETIGRLGSEVDLAAGAGGRGERVPRPPPVRAAEETVSHRNGYELRTVKTTSGPSGWIAHGCATRPSSGSSHVCWAGM
jgi:hypothetical protein